MLFIQKTLRVLLIGLLLAYFVAASAMLGIRYLVLPHIDAWRPEIEKRLSNALGAQVTMGEVAASWSGLNPTLALENLRLRDRQTNQELLYVPDAFAVVSWRSIFALDLRLRQLEINGVHLSGSRRPDGRIVLAGTLLDEASNDRFKFSTDAPSVRWLLNQGLIVVRDATFMWDDQFRGAPDLTIKGIDIQISNSIFRHQLRVSGTLPPELGNTVELIVRTDKIYNPLASHEQGGAEVFIEINDAQPGRWQPWVDVPQIHGRFATRLWMTLSDGHFGRATVDLAGAHARFSSDGDDAISIQAEHLGLRLNGWLGDLFPENKWLIFDRSPNRVGASVSLTGQALQLESQIFEPRTLRMGDVSINTQLNRHDNQQLQIIMSQLKLQSEDLSAELSGTWTQDKGASLGHIDLKGSILEASPANLHQYVTTEVSDASREWMRRALRGGKFSQLDLTIQGDLKQFPFNAPDQTGVFRIEGQIDDVLIDYDYVDPNMPQWPAVAIDRGHFVLDRLGLTVKSDEAHIKVADAKGADARLIKISGLEIKAPDLDLNPNLSIRLHSFGTAQDYIGVLSRTPVAHDLVKQLLTLDIHGQVSMPLAVDFDLEQERTSLVSGQLKLTDVSLALSKDGVSAEKINGVLDFSDETVVVKELTGVALGGPVTLTGEWGPQKRSLALNGALTSVGSEKHQKMSAMLAISGRTSYEADIKGTDAGGVDINLRSSLEGLTIKLPAPLGKSAAQKRPLSLRFLSTGSGKAERSTLTFSLANLLNGRFEHIPNGKGQSFFTRGALVMGGPAVLPASGLLINLGFDRVNWDDWKGLTDQITAPPKQNNVNGSPVLFPDLQQLRIRSPEFIFAELTLNQLDLMISRTSSQKWAARLESKQTQGVASWTTSQKGLVGPVVARFSKLSVGTEGGAAGEPPKTEVIDDKQWSSMPAIDLSVEDFTLYGSRLGSLHLLGANADNGTRWMINELEVINPHATLKAKGSWLLKGDSRGVSLDGEVSISNLGKLSDQLGYENRAAEGAGTIKAKINWRNFPWVFTYQGLSGDVNVDLKDGVFQHVNSRSARLLEVLSLQSLQRILSLNFRAGDEFKDGFPWNSITGDLSISQGVVNTTNLVVRSPIARIGLTGGSDLNHKTWNLDADVRPILDMSGAALATAFVVNPIAGLSALVTQFLLRNPIERAMSAKYEVKGTWDEPELIPIGAPTPVANPNEPAGG